MNSQYTIENLEQNISCENLDQSMNSIEDASQDIENGNSNISNVISDTDNSENSENSESQSESNEQKIDMSNIEKDESENSHLQINPLPTDSSNNQINEYVNALASSEEICPIWIGYENPEFVEKLNKLFAPPEIGIICKPFAEYNVQSNQISSEMSREEMESAMDESCTSLMEGI
jgi:hypothetical protein